MNSLCKKIILCGPSGVGKSTIAKHLLNIKENQLNFSISATSRLPRGHEIHGKDYYFFDIQTFKSKIKQNHFIEFEEVYPNNFYGTLKYEIERIKALKKHILFDIDVKGGLRLKTIFGHNALSIFIAPPSLETLKERLVNRKTDKLSVIENRLLKAQSEIDLKNQFDIVIVNDDKQTALNEISDSVHNFLS